MVIYRYEDDYDDDDVGIHTAHINLTNGPVHPRPPELVPPSTTYILYYYVYTL